MLRTLSLAAALLLALGCAMNQVWVRKDGQNIRNSEKLTQRFLRDNGACEAKAARGMEGPQREVVLGGNTEYGPYGGVVREDQEEAQRKREMERAGRFRACMDDKGYEQISSKEADAKYGKRPEGFQAPF
jgi:hypothetical protein